MARQPKHEPNILIYPRERSIREDPIRNSASCQDNAFTPGWLNRFAPVVLAFGLLFMQQASALREAENPPESSLPDAPSPQTPASSQTPKPVPCQPGTQNVLPSGNGAGSSSSVVPTPPPCVPRKQNWYQHFAAGPKDKILTPRDKGWLAARNLVDPFNLLTIGGEAAITIAVDSHTPYGPGFPGYARDVGVSFTEDLTGEFFGTFLIPSLTHQDPHYHRLEHAGIPRRAVHAISQVVWTQSDTGKGMLNYSNLVGFAADDEISNLYVPGRETNAGATSARYLTGIATAPIGNFINEFLPDVARHIHVQIVIIQRVINQVARSETTNSQ